MKKTLLILAIFSSFSCLAQQKANHIPPAANNVNNMGNSSKVAAVQGTITLPALMKINISQSNSQPLVLNSLDDYYYGKISYGIANINVKSSRPWVINVTAEGPFANSFSNVNASAPVSMFGFKESTNDEFVMVTNAPQPLLISDNNNIENNYTIDMQVKPGFGQQGGNYTANIIFTLTQQ